jgi:hypothetical protein
MSDLVFIAFDNEKQAEEVREKVLEMQREYLIATTLWSWCAIRMAGSNLTSSCIRRRAARSPEPSGAC